MSWVVLAAYLRWERWVKRKASEIGSAVDFFLLGDACRTCLDRGVAPDPLNEGRWINCPECQDEMFPVGDA